MLRAIEMRTIHSVRASLILGLASIALPLCGWSQTTTKTLSLNDLLARMQQAENVSRNNAVPYTVTREYQLSAQGAPRPNSNVVAEVNVVPPTSKDFTIVKTEGSDRGASIVRKVLDHEAQLAGHPEVHELTARNYDFAILGREIIDGHDCYVLQLTPKREAVELVRGKAWIDATTYALQRIQGATAKAPSMWIRNLTITVDYGDVNGVRVQMATRAVADVRFAGTHVLTSKELDVRTSAFDAANHSASRVHRNRSNARESLADTAAWMAR
jgi:hypothetical protein